MPQTSNKAKIVPLEQIAHDLKGLSDETWGRYAFSRDLLKEKIDEKTMLELIHGSIQAGKEAAKKIQIQYPNFAVPEVVAAHGVRVEKMKAEDERIGNRIMFALYTPPDLVQLASAPIEKLGAFDLPWLAKETVENLMLGHELFHHIETHDPEIFTQKTKITLWKVLFYSYRTNVRATSEIAAMVFTKILNDLDYSPFMLDILLFYAYEPETATTMYYEVLDFLNENS